MAEENKTWSIQNIINGTSKQAVLILCLFLLVVVDTVCINHLILRPLKIYMKCVREGTAFELLGAYEFKYLALTYNNIFEIRRESEQMLRHKAEHDPLTGLLNRGAFNRISEQYTGRDICLAVLVIDIDVFKTINDTYGHSVGDEVIKGVAELLQHSFRPTDVVARIGGDEFAIIMLDVTKKSGENIIHKMDRLNEALERPTSHLPKTSISVGAAFSEYGYSDELFKLADGALYDAKRNGRHGCVVSKEHISYPSREEKPKN